MSNSKMNSFFYTYNERVYSEHEDCRFKSIMEIVNDIKNEFYSNLYDDGWEFMKSIKNSYFIIKNCILLETIHRLGFYVVGDGYINYISNVCENIKVRYSAEFIQSVVDYFLLKYVEILEFNKEYYGL